MTGEGFWARKTQQLKPYDLQPAKQVLSPRLDRPWWNQSAVSQEQPVVNPGTRKAILDGTEIEIDLDENGQYRPRKASHLRNSGRCPECDSGNFGRGANTSAAMRCFDCGYVEGRNIADSNRPIGISSNAPSQRSRQITKMNVLDDTGRPLGVTTAASGLQSNYHGPSKEGTMSGKDVLTHINGV